MSSGELLLLRMQLDIIGTNYLHFLSLKKRQRDSFREEIKRSLLCLIERGALHPSMDRNGAPGPESVGFPGPGQLLHVWKGRLQKARQGADTWVTKQVGIRSSPVHCDSTDGTSSEFYSRTAGGHWEKTSSCFCQVLSVSCLWWFQKDVFSRHQTGDVQPFRGWGLGPFASRREGPRFPQQQTLTGIFPRRDENLAKLSLTAWCPHPQRGWCSVYKLTSSSVTQRDRLTQPMGCTDPCLSLPPQQRPQNLLLPGPRAPGSTGPASSGGRGPRAGRASWGRGRAPRGGACVRSGKRRKQVGPTKTIIQNVPAWPRRHLLSSLEKRTSAVSPLEFYCNYDFIFWYIVGTVAHFLCEWTLKSIKLTGENETP